jgi:membrane protein DedA with SNARE-associated domain
MDLSTILHSYGGPVLLIWSSLQGEPAVIVGGSLAAQGYWPWWAVWLAATLPAVLGHQLYFYLGRRFGPSVVARLSPGMAPGVRRARELLRSHERRVMLGMRFAYGIRLPLPILCGEAGVAPGRFLRYNVGTGLAWAFGFTLLGYGCGAAAAAAFKQAAHYGAWLVLTSTALALAVPVIAHRLARR